MLCQVLAFGQNLTGHWSGEIPEPQADQSLKFVIETDIVQTGNKISGTSKYMLINYGRWAIESFTGTVNGNTVNMIEHTGISCYCINGDTYCLKNMTGKFTIDTLNSHYRIEGTWTSDSSYNGKTVIKTKHSPGAFFLTRKADIKPAPPVVAAIPPAPSIKPVIKPWDGYYQKTSIATSRVTPYAPLREADVIFSKRIWEEFDLREKMNNYLGSPKARLIDVLMDAVMAGELTAYDPTATKEDPGGDMFTKAYTPQEAKLRLADSSLVTLRDANNNTTGSHMVLNDFVPDSILRFRIKEDYYFDKQRSVYEPRIIGIAPLFKPKGAAGMADDYIPAFWIYFPDARQVLATKEIANRDNDATGLSFDDVFMKRMFTGYIVKQSNNKDERIRDYANGIDRLYESQRIKQALMDWELDLWQY